MICDFFHYGLFRVNFLCNRKYDLSLFSSLLITPNSVTEPQHYSISAISILEQLGRLTMVIQIYICYCIFYYLFFMNNNVFWHC